MKLFLSFIAKIFTPKEDDSARDRFLSKATNAIDVERLQRQWD